LPQRAWQIPLLEYHGPQLADSGPKERRCTGQRDVDSAHGVGRQPITSLFEVHAGGQDILQSFVVQPVGQLPPLSALEVE
jgi:hypothetical protein